MTKTQSTALASTAVSDDLLAEFDRLTSSSADLPLDALQARYATSQYFRYRDHEIYDVLLELPVTVHMIVSGKTDPVARIIAALKEIHGDNLLIDLDSQGSTPRLRVRMWKPEKVLRGLWKQFAEAEYKSALAVAS